MSKIHQMTLNAMAHLTKDNEIVEQAKFFEFFDENNDGYISLRELKKIFSQKFDRHQIRKILMALDADKNGAVNYNEFIAATLGTKLIFNIEKI